MSGGVWVPTWLALVFLAVFVVLLSVSVAAIQTLGW